MNDDNMTDLNEEDNFRTEYKRYKRRCPPPSMDDVIDVDKGCDNTLHSMSLELSQECLSQVTGSAAVLGLKSPLSWQCYNAQGFPGFQYIRNPFLPGFQRYWVKRCLAHYCCKPNVTNMDPHLSPELLTNPWQMNSDKLSSSRKPVKDKSPLERIRWVTLGYHYDWTNKLYHKDHHTPFPEDLSVMSMFILNILGHRNFQPEAGVVNFYHMDSTLGGHTDHSEFDLSAPLISYSLGQSAILLVGGQTKATKPMALHLRSGDIAIFGGESRLAYHAVPRIMHWDEKTPELPPCFGLLEHQNEETDLEKLERTEVTERETAKDGEICPALLAGGNIKGVGKSIAMEMDVLSKGDEWRLFELYLKNARINISVRQVLEPGKGFPSRDEEETSQCSENTCSVTEPKRAKSSIDL